MEFSISTLLRLILPPFCTSDTRWSDHRGATGGTRAVRVGGPSRLTQTINHLRDARQVRSTASRRRTALDSPAVPLRSTSGSTGDTIDLHVDAPGITPHWKPSEGCFNRENPHQRFGVVETNRFAGISIRGGGRIFHPDNWYHGVRVHEALRDRMMHDAFHDRPPGSQSPNRG